MDAFGDYTPQIVEWALRVALAVAILVATFVVARWARALVERVMGRAEIDPTVGKFLAALARWAVLAGGVLAALSKLGIETTSFAALLAGAGLAVGMALSGTLSHFAAGVLLLTFRPFRVGDVVNAAGVTGKVDEIGLFTTALDTPDNRRLVIPNSQILGGTIENVTYHPTRRVEVSVGCDYAADVERTREVLLAAARAVDGVLDEPAPAVVLVGLGASSVDWAVRVWVPAERFWPVKDALTAAIKRALDDAGIGIPFPQMDVHVDGVAAVG